MLVEVTGTQEPFRRWEIHYSHIALLSHRSDLISRDVNIGVTEVVEQEKGTLKPLNVKSSWTSSITGFFEVCQG